MNAAPATSSTEPSSFILPIRWKDVSFHPPVLAPDAPVEEAIGEVRVRSLSGVPGRRYLVRQPMVCPPISAQARASRHFHINEL